MTFSQSVRVCFAKTIVFAGRADRSEFWWFQLFRCLVTLIPLLGWLFNLMTLLPALSVTVRRLHDTNRSGWWLLPMILSPILLLLPFFGILLHLDLPFTWRQWFDPDFFTMGAMDMDGADAWQTQFFGYFYHFDSHNITDNPFAFALFILLIGYTLLLIYWLLKRGDTGYNAYGLPPKDTIL